METNQAVRLKNATTMVRAFIMNAESKSELDLYAKAMESAIRGAVIDAQNMITIKCMSEDEEEIEPTIPLIEEDVEEPEEEPEEQEEETEEPKEEPKEEKRHRGRPPKNPMKQA